LGLLLSLCHRKAARSLRANPASSVALALTRQRLKRFDEAGFAETLALWPAMLRAVRDRQA